jgi:hypothetical protein
MPLLNVSKHSGKAWVVLLLI